MTIIYISYIGNMELIWFEDAHVTLLSTKGILKWGGKKQKTQGGVQKLPHSVTEGLQDTQNHKASACGTSLNMNV